jgi:hypothetical protein
LVWEFSNAPKTLWLGVCSLQASIANRRGNLRCLERMRRLVVVLGIAPDRRLKKSGKAKRFPAVAMSSLDGLLSLEGHRA